MEKNIQNIESGAISLDRAPEAPREQTTIVSSSSEIQRTPTRIAQLKDEIEDIINARKKVETMKYYDNLPYSALPDQVRSTAETSLESKQAELVSLEREIADNRKHWWQKTIAITAFFTGGLFGTKDVSTQKRPDPYTQETTIEKLTK